MFTMKRKSTGNFIKFHYTDTIQHSDPEMHIEISETEGVNVFMESKEIFEKIVESGYCVTYVNIDHRDIDVHIPHEFHNDIEIVEFSMTQIFR